MIGRYKEWNLQKQRKGASQGIDWLVLVYPIICLQHHVALICFEHLFDMINAGCHAGFPRPFLLLYCIGTIVEWERQEVHTQAQRNNCRSSIAYDAKCNAIDQLKKELQWPKQELIESLQNCHANFPLMQFSSCSFEQLHYCFQNHFTSNHAGSISSKRLAYWMY